MQHGLFILELLDCTYSKKKLKKNKENRNKKKREKESINRTKLFFYFDLALRNPQEMHC